MMIAGGQRENEEMIFCNYMGINTLDNETTSVYSRAESIEHFQRRSLGINIHFVSNSFQKALLYNEELKGQITASHE
jgi:hypothetical protein